MSLTLPPATRLPRFALFGNLCHFTTAFLRQALEAGIEIAAIALPGLPVQDTPLNVRLHQSGSGLVVPTTRPERLADIALAASIPVYRVGRLASGSSIALFQSLQADCILSVCFPRRIPERLINALSVPALNVHPSMLPDLRGPDPMFWTFHEGSGRSGVTVHHLTYRFDAGPIVSQQEHRYIDGASEQHLESDLAHLAVEMIQQLQPGIVDRPIPCIEQQEEAATYARFPEADDYRIQRTWTAQRAFNFASGLLSRGVPLTVEVDGTVQIITGVHAYKKAKPQVGTGIAIRFADGFLVADATPASP
jgi:methionyl-tRNA formyltransferase